MYVLFEEDGSFKVGQIMSEADNSLQVEALTGKRSKIKAATVMLRFKDGATDLLARAEALTADMDLDFLWEMAPEDEFAFDAFAEDYFGHAPSAAEAAAVLTRLHGAPMYFYRKGKGRYKKAPEDTLKAALAGLEKKRLQQEKIVHMATELQAGRLPDELRAQVPMLLYKPDKNSLEWKALDEAMKATSRSPLDLLRAAGGVVSHHDYHMGAFLHEFFPRGTGFPELELATAPTDLPLAEAEAFSIDDAATTEIDDAFSVVLLPDGSARVGVHIAAPALGIPVGGPLDQIAMTRLSTVYMPGNKITMLPDSFVNVFTLQEGTPCPALSLYLDIAADGTVKPGSTRVERIHIAQNLRHDTLEVNFNQAALDAGDATPYPYKAELEYLWKLANQLEAGRGKTPDPSRPQNVDYNFVVEDDRVAIVPRLRGSPIDKVVAELMILVNSHWGGWLAEHRVPAIYRAQGAGRTRMTTSPEPHQGLGVAQYAWSSSPLRRAVDLINQRQLIALVQGDKPPYPKAQDLFVPMREFDAAYTAYLTFQERMETYWCLRWLEQEQIGEIDGTVLRDGVTVRLAGLPLLAKPDGMPELPQGTAVRVKVLGVDLWNITSHTHFLRAHDPVAPVAA